MGREALIHAEVGNEAGEVKALLESQELILRGDIRRRVPKSAMTGLAVERDALCFRHNSEHYRLELGAKVAASWAEAIVKPPPSLQTKLGLDKGGLALVCGAIEDAQLANALTGTMTEDPAKAAMIIALIDSETDLKTAFALWQQLPALPIWTIYPKGKSVVFGDTAIRESLRACGLRDSKSCSVSDRLTATRYGKVVSG
jgi:hypothetical protein